MIDKEKVRARIDKLKQWLIDCPCAHQSNIDKIRAERDTLQDVYNGEYDVEENKSEK